MKKTLTVITALLLAFTFAFGSVSVYADNKSDLKDVQNEIDDKEKELKEGKKEEKRNHNCAGIPGRSGITGSSGGKNKRVQRYGTAHQ